jgi:hypothetical protein
MPQTVTLTIATKFPDGGPKIPDAPRENKVGACMSVIEEVPNDKNWTEYEVLAGERDQIEFLLLAADRYKDQNCPREDEPGLLFRYDNDDSFALRLDGPLLYTGHTASCLPTKVDKIYIQNRMTDKVKFYLLVGRKQQKKNKNGNNANAAAAAMPANTATTQIPM